MTSDPNQNTSAPESLGQSITNTIESVASAVADKLMTSKKDATDIPGESLEGTKEHKIAESVGMVGMGAHEMAGSDVVTQMLGQEATEPRQECMLFPTYGVPTTIDNELHWKINVAGWLYADPPRSRMESLLVGMYRYQCFRTHTQELTCGHYIVSGRSSCGPCDKQL